MTEFRSFSISERNRQVLLDRYHRAIELIDTKVAHFYSDASRAGLLDDTLLIVTSDHGEAFGEHGLYLHDGSAYNTHLHVPLWVHHPERESEVVTDVVSTRSLFNLICAVGRRETLKNTILDGEHRAGNPVVVAEHFYYPHLRDMLPKYRRNLRAVIAAEGKTIVSDGSAVHYRLSTDPDEKVPMGGPIPSILARLPESQRSLSSVIQAFEHLSVWQ